MQYFFFLLVEANNQSSDTATAHFERVVKSEL